MRKIIIILITLLFGIALFNNMNKEKEIRVRIIPNSNSAFDLEIKEEAKLIVSSYLEEVYDNNYDKCKDNIIKTKEYLSWVLNEHLGYVSVSFDYHTLYNKTYNNNAVKNDSYYTLYIVIGNGDGDNWWGTIYPNLLEISSSEEIKYESFFVNLLNTIKEK